MHKLIRREDGRVLMIGTYDDCIARLNFSDPPAVWQGELWEEFLMAKKADKRKVYRMRGSKERFSFGPPIERPKAEKWSPRKGETFVFQLLKITSGEFGTGYLVANQETGESVFLPNHGVLMALMKESSLKPGDYFQVKCTRKGSRKVGDFYDYEVRPAKGR
jgi:hypothetical protein